MKCWWHKWKLIKDTQKHQYFECVKCGERKVEQMYTSGYQPIDKACWEGTTGLEEDDLKDGLLAIRRVLEFINSSDDLISTNEIMAEFGITESMLEN